MWIITAKSVSSSFGTMYYVNLGRGSLGAMSRGGHISLNIIAIGKLILRFSSSESVWCIDVILNMWVRVLRWAFRQMSLIQCSWKWFSTIDTVSSGKAGTLPLPLAPATLVPRPCPLMFNPPLWSWLTSWFASTILLVAVDRRRWIFCPIFF